jgi:RNA polymerase sigma-70 factor (ECF subfamily)
MSKPPITPLVRKKLKGYIARKVDDERDIEEILQETLIAAVESWPSFRGQSAFLTWLGGIANHEIADFYRKKKIKSFLFSRFPFLESLVSEALGPEEELLKAELRGEVKEVLGHLSEGYSQVLRLKYYQGLSMKEIAQKLDLTVKAVESRLSRAREAFRQQWQLSYEEK